MSDNLQVALVDLKEWLQSSTAPIIGPIKDEGKSLLDKIRNRFDDIRENGDRILVKSDKEVQKGSSKTYRCAKSANKMSRDILDIIDQIAVPEDTSYGNFRLLIVDLEKTLAAIEHERRVWYRRISPYFILDRRRLDIAIKRAGDSIQELRSFLFQEYVKVETAEKTLDMVDRLSQLLEEAENVRKQLSQRETRIKLFEDKIQERGQKIGIIQNQDELNRLSKLEQRIRDLKVKVKYDLRHLQKPFYKMQSLAHRAQVALPPDEVRKLEQYMKNPFEAFSSEEKGYPILKRIVQKLDEIIRRDKLKLKPARLRKARKQIDGILKKGSLVNLHLDCLEAISKKRQLLTSETVTGTQRELEQLQKTLQKLQRQRESIEARRKVLEEKHKRILKNIESQKIELEKSIVKVIDKNVQVVFTAGS